jgi:uncharacterized protein
MPDMSASQTPHPDPGSQQPGDPSMEDILASIRRILSEDEIGPAPEGGPGDDVLALDESMLVPDQGAPTSAAEAPPPAGPIAKQAPPMPLPPQPEPIPPVESGPPPPANPAAPLVAPAAAAAAAGSVGTLLRTLVNERQQVAVHRGGPTLEDMVREEIRPLLAAWLDTNLPPLVERLVRAEIERVVGRASS